MALVPSTFFGQVATLITIGKGDLSGGGPQTRQVRLIDTGELGVVFSECF
jgi:hypothetical protein